MEGGITGLKVLLIDDDVLSLELFDYVLGLKHAIVKKASSVSEAVRILENWRPHVLVSDVGMPGEDGLSLMRKFRSIKENADIRMVAVTGYSSAAYQTQLHDAGCTQVLIKPVDPEMLISILEKIAQQIR